MIRNVLVIAALLSLSACGSASRIGANLTGYTNECVDGVKYVQFPSGVTVKYGPDGKIVTC